MIRYPEKYKLTHNLDVVVRIRDGAFMSAKSPAYTSWLTEGNTPENADPLPTSNYKELRAAEYPPKADYLDGVIKGDQVQIESYIAACLAVKAKYPKS